MVETEDLVQLRSLNLELLRQLWAGQDAVRQSVAQAVSKLNLDSSSNHDAETPSFQEMTATTSGASSPLDAPQDDTSGLTWPGRASSQTVSVLPPKCQPQKSSSQPRPHSSTLLDTSDSSNPELSTELGGLGSQDALQTPRQTLASLCLTPQPRVTFRKESLVPEQGWRLRPYLGYDWIAGSLDSTSPITSKSEGFFLTLQEFRKAHEKECISRDSESRFLSFCESSNVDEDHECVYCYRVNQRLFLVPADPGITCRLCKTPRDQRGLETLAEPAQVRVSIPLSVLEPPHRYRIHRRKSFDASDTLALPRHCLVGWDIIPPKPEKSSASRNLDLWSSVSSKPQHRSLSSPNSSHLALPTQFSPPTPIWLEPQVVQPHACSRSPEV
ncbi:PREDICTED: migration and invasion-inhibitory protein [Elephantulus edwardii]|uniref:migration and invasion-inhibitory protein n=1 Tax=Elephantulus edwardii TaxID=28737 RepID=UPI0003F0DCF4|nr:PREDICTED: migration and invasion-inhibitory protein [Elephantulus edwardii]